MGRPALNLTGRIYDRLTVIERAEPSESDSAKSAYWRCRCSCGNETIVRSQHLRTGNVRSCGCLAVEVCLPAMAASNVTHGMSQSDEHRIWQYMIQRCHNPNAGNYYLYGGRGIEVCERWRESFEAFYADVGPRPSKDHSLERKNNSKGYEPGNVVWATRLEQNNNTRRNRRVCYRGRDMTLAQAIRAAGNIVNYDTARHRFCDKGWSIETAVETPTT